MKILNVFTNERGQHGNPVGIVLDVNRTINNNERQKMTRESGFSEVVFVNSIDPYSVSIYSPQNEIPFAGHAVVGAAYFLNSTYQKEVAEIESLGGKIDVWQEGKYTWARCNSQILPDWNYEELTDPREVELLHLSMTSQKSHVFVWAWVDENKGIVRARTFATDWGIPEDEANGSGSMKLAMKLNRELTIQHGKGSIIHSRPSLDSNMAEVGGIVAIQD